MVAHFFIGLMGSLMGTIAIGPANLGVINITIRHNTQAASRFSVAAALVEVLYATAAILSGKLIVNKIDEYPYIRVLVILFFLLAGIYFIIKKENLDNGGYDRPVGKSFFMKGLLVAVINPQTIPYWLFVTTYLTAHNFIHLSSWMLVVFLAGGFIGKFISLSLYGQLSAYIKKRKTSAAFYLNKFIGITLILIAIIQAIYLY
jgi:threonine/homoserine/homoserine lactone efflux protein